MIVINTVDAQRFSLNGIEYFKNFTPVVAGDSVRILNTYTSYIELVHPTNYSDFTVNGNTFANVSDLQSALLPVIYTRDTLGGGGGASLPYINVKDFGALGNGINDDTSSIQSAIDSVSSDSLVLYFPSGIYKTTVRINVWNKFKYIKIFGDNAIIQPTMSDNLDSFRIGTVSSESSPIYPISVKVNDISFDFVNSNPISLSSGITFNSVLGELTVFNCDFYNYQNNNTAGVEMLNIGNDPTLLKNNSHNGFELVSCNFWNPSSVEESNYDYLNNNTFGIGVIVGSLNSNASEYWDIITPQFNNIYKALWIRSGANGTITGGKIQNCNPILSGGSIEDGIVRLENSSDNTGKLTVNGVKCNHNKGTVFYSSYVDSSRPLDIFNCQFIANAYLPIKINGAGRCTIASSFFDRANLNHINTPAFSVRHYIILLNSNITSVTGNTFADGADRCISVGSSTGVVITNNIHSSGTTLTNLTDGDGFNTTVQNNYLK